MNLLINEILQKVSNAKTKIEKITILQQYDSPALRTILIANFDESVTFLLPEGDVPYKKNEAPEDTEHTRLSKEYRVLYNFVKGGNGALTQNKREMMFIQLLEGLHQNEAEILCMVKDKTISKRYKITRACVEEAYPQIVWGNRG
jgi:hypothetical protein